MKIVIAGGSGFLGSALQAHFSKHHEVYVLTRGSVQKESVRIHWVRWDAETLGDWVTCLEGVDVLINLCGKSVNCRYNRSNREEIISSRVNTTLVLGKAMARLVQKPKLWINASSATIYPHSFGESMTEQSALGTGFSVEVCKAWEEAFFSINLSGLRQVSIRSSMVFGRNGSIYKTLRALALRGMGGTQGDGKQYVSWIHIDDFLRAIDYIIMNQDVEGVLNVCSPDPRKNRDFNSLLRNSLGVKVHFPIKKWMVYLGAFFMGTEAELVLKSRKVIPQYLLKHGFRFKYNNLESALKDLNKN